MIKKYALVLVAIFCFVLSGFGQILYTENMYNGTGGGSGNSIAVHETNNRFNEDGLTYSGTGDMRTTNASTLAYTGASGTWNVMLNASGETLIMDGIDATATTGNLVLSFGVRKGTVASNGSELIIEYSTTGSSGTYTSLAFPNLPTGSGTATWHYRSSTSIIPSNVTTFRFRGTDIIEWRIDDILLEETCTPPTNPNGTISGTTLACNSTDLSYSHGTGQPETDVDYYWQTSATGTSMVNIVSTDLTVNTSGIYYVRAYNTVTSCWSTTSVASSSIVINTAPIISTQPTNQSATIPDTATFTVVSGNATSFQWEVNTGTGWNNVTGGSGDTTASYTTGVTSAIMDGNQYRCIVTNVCGSIPSNVAILNTFSVADVVITEIMYNTAGTDDEWIEICNVSGTVQNLSNYIIDVGGSTEFTFPASTTIANGTCITISLGSNGDLTYNNGNGTIGYCPFTPDYGIGASSNDTDNLVNSSNIITLFAANGTTIVDEVTYDDGDGADGNGSSLHVVDATTDNSDTGTNWQEVDYGGTSGINSLIPNCLPAGVDINVEGNLGNYPDIADGDITPSPFDNTLFAAQFVGASQAKSYRIQNLLGNDLELYSVIISGADSGNFSISMPPASPVVYGTPSILEITFAPLTSGIKNATVSITNNDDDSAETNYTFDIQGEGKCLGSIDSVFPASGPVGTVITVSATGLNLSTAAASFNGVPATIVNYISLTDELEVTVPNGATTGNLVVFDANCTAITPFIVINSQIGGCEGGANLTDLIISEITDATVGGVSYIEIFNGTSAIVPLGDYALSVFANGSASPAYTLGLNSVNLNQNAVYVVAIGITNSPDYVDPDANTCSIAGGNGELANQTSTLAGINKKTDEHDMIRLVKSSGTIVVDEFGVYLDNDWMDSTIITGDRGFNFRRLNTASPLPNPTFNINDWNVIDWVGQGLVSCPTNDYSDIGVYDFSTSAPPTINNGPGIIYSCESATISVTATESVTDSIGLTFQWYYSAPGEIGWTAITDDGVIYDNSTTATLDILNTTSLTNTQYYCQVREDDATCYQASDAVKLKPGTVTWDGTNWNWNNGTAQNTMPNSSNTVILNGSYDTAIGGIQSSFSACQLIVTPGNLLTISAGNYVEVINNVEVTGDGSDNDGILIEDKGSFVQRGNGIDAGSFTLNTNGFSRVNKRTAPLNNYYEYTYWSSPTIGETVGGGLEEAHPTRRYWYNAQNYLDETAETNNNNGTVNGQDDIDDNGDDWQPTNNGNLMIPGVGYAAMHDPIGFNNVGGQYEYIFEGAFNTGDIDVPIYRNDLELQDNNWNLIGNPYPSAVDADLFLTTNTLIAQDVSELPTGTGTTDGAIFFWSQSTAPSDTANGNENLNFAQSDYAIINATGQTAGGDGVMPSRFIPSGQAFFVSYSDAATPDSTNGNINTGTVSFTNSMRVTGNNNQFFRNSSTQSNRLWVNMWSDNGVRNQILVGYVEGATNTYDGMYYDAPKNLSSEVNAMIYTVADNSDKKLAIQGKAVNSLNLDEVIPLGFYTLIPEATLYSISIDSEGLFFEENIVYLKDYELGILHDLSASDYTFTSETGEFNNRFEIVFRDSFLSINEEELSVSNLTIIELQNGEVQFKVPSQFEIKTVEIIDLLGRTIYKLNGQSSTETYNLSNLSQATYIAKVTLANGQVLTKKAVKRM